MDDFWIVKAREYGEAHNTLNKRPLKTGCDGCTIETCGSAVFGGYCVHSLLAAYQDYRMARAAKTERA